MDGWMDPWLNTRTVHTHALTCTQAETWPITVGFKSNPDQLLPENKSACPIGILSTQTDIPDIGLREISCLIRRSTYLLPNIHYIISGHGGTRNRSTRIDTRPASWLQAYFRPQVTRSQIWKTQRGPPVRSADTLRSIAARPDHYRKLVGSKIEPPI
jgi:hypothetical protein